MQKRGRERDTHTHAYEYSNARRGKEMRKGTELDVVGGETSPNRKGGIGVSVYEERKKVIHFERERNYDGGDGDREREREDAEKERRR